MGFTTDDKCIPEAAVNLMVQIANEYGMDGKRVALRYIPAKDGGNEAMFIVSFLTVKDGGTDG